MNNSKLEAALGPDYKAGTFFASSGYSHEPKHYHRAIETGQPLTFTDIHEGMYVFVWNRDNEVVIREGEVIRGIEEEDDPFIGKTHTLVLQTEEGEEKVYAFMMGLKEIWTTNLQANCTYRLRPR